MKRIQTVFSGVAGTPWYSNMYFADSEGAQECVDKVAEFWVLMADYIVNDVSWTVDGQVLTIDAANGAITGSVVVSGNNYAGEQTQEMLPTATQLVVRWLTGAYVNGRQVQGRTFIPGLADFCNNNGVVDPSIVTAITTQANTWLSTSPEPLVYAKTAGESRLVTQAVCWNQFSILRSRRD